MINSRSYFPTRRAVLLLLIGALLAQARAGCCTTGAEYRRMADQSVRAGQYEQAAAYYRLEAGVYRGLGDVNAAKIEEMKAERWSTELSLYVDMAPYRPGLLGQYTGAKYEPVYGCYVGGYVEADDRLDFTIGERGAPLMREEAFGVLLHKRMGTFFQYNHYGEHFPLRWARALCKRHIAPHISLEPNAGLQYVRDDAYLRRFAHDALLCGGPVFLRFAAEMNGDWTTYHPDPALYREKFRLVHDVMARLAPNVAMIWCPASIPEHNIDDYYPGDDAVDWVGVNFYSVIHHNNSLSHPAWFENPTSQLKYVYHRYAARKPIAICEYGSSHREALNPAADYSAIAINKIAAMYASLPRQFPRVKLIDIFDCNNLQHARPGRQLNDYSVTDNAAVRGAFQQAIASSYFLSEVAPRPQLDLPRQTSTLLPGTVLGGTVHLSAWVKTYEDRPTVIYSVDGQPVVRLNSPGDYGANVDTTRFSPGRHLLSIDVVDSYGRRAARRQLRVSFGAPGSGDGLVYDVNTAPH